MRWPKEEREFAVKAYFANGFSVVRTQRAFRRQFNLRPGAPVPGRQSIVCWTDTFSRSGSVQRKHPGPRLTRRTPENVEAVRLSFLRYPELSARKQAAALGMSVRTYRRIINNDLHEYIEQNNLSMAKRKSPSNDSTAVKKYKRPPSAYSLFLKSTWEKDEKKDNFSAFTKNCSALWAKMTDDDKQKYKDEAAMQKEKWVVEKPEIKKAEPKKKRSPGPYIMFCSEMRDKVKKENPDFSMTMISKELGILWNKLSSEEKAIYQQKANEEKDKISKEEGEK